MKRHLFVALIAILLPARLLIGAPPIATDHAATTNTVTVSAASDAASAGQSGSEAGETKDGVVLAAHQPAVEAADSSDLAPAITSSVSAAALFVQDEDLPDDAVILPDSELLPDYTSSFRQWSDTGRCDPRYSNSGSGGYFDNFPSNVAVRFGWWFVNNDGSDVKTGEWQDLDSSPFYDVDGLLTDGNSTLNYSVTGTDDETNQVGLDFYAPNFKAEFDYQRFIHRLDNDPFDNFVDADDRVNASATPVLIEDLNVGEDYAIRIEELDAEASGKLTDNLKLKVRFWQLHKFGERQSNSMAHCFNVSSPSGGNYCHVVSQRQRIDWVTTEVTPSLEWQEGRLSVEYSRPMRSFSQNDQLVMRDFSNLGLSQFFPPFGSNAANPYVASYGVVPDNFTQIDQLKVGADLNDNLNFYGFAYYGQTENKIRNVDRDFGGYDLRLTDHSIDRLTVTAYAKLYTQNGDRPDTLIDDETRNLTDQEAQDQIRDPVEYRRNSFGLDARLRPDYYHPMFQRITLVSGYEYRSMERQNAVYEGVNSSFAQPDTITNAVNAGLEYRWSQSLDTYTRYKVRFNEDPLYGFRSENGAINSSMPEQQHTIQVGGVWTPANNFAFTTHLEIDARRHYADFSQVQGNVIDFDEESYPITLTAWWAPTRKLSMTAGVAFLTNWIDQNITLGNDYVADPMNPGSKLNPVTSRWNYDGHATVVSYSVDYAWRPNLRLIGGWEYSRSENGFTDPGYIGVDGGGNPAFVDANLGQYSNVLIETQRITAGADWKPSPKSPMSVYGRYILFDYEDKSQSYNSGLAHMALAGFTLVR